MQMLKITNSFNYQFIIHIYSILCVCISVPYISLWLSLTQDFPQSVCGSGMFPIWVARDTLECSFSEFQISGELGVSIWWVIQDTENLVCLGQGSGSGFLQFEHYESITMFAFVKYFCLLFSSEFVLCVTQLCYNISMDTIIL